MPYNVKHLLPPICRRAHWDSRSCRGCSAVSRLIRQFLSVQADMLKCCFVPPAVKKPSGTFLEDEERPGTQMIHRFIGCWLFTVVILWYVLSSITSIDGAVNGGFLSVNVSSMQKTFHCVHCSWSEMIIYELHINQWHNGCVNKSMQKWIYELMWWLC